MMPRIITNNKKSIVAAIVIVALSALLYSLLDTPKGNTVETKQENLVEFNGSNLEEKKDGKLIWRLNAEKILVDPDTQVMHFTKPEAVIADVDGKEITITADTGTADKVKREIVINPPVRAHTNEGDTLTTDGSVYYNMDTRIISGGKVLVKRNDSTELSGDSFETNAALDKVLIKGHAKLTKGN
jgi:LPS export ABC transporter protein LptC